MTNFRICLVLVCLCASLLSPVTQAHSTPQPSSLPWLVQSKSFCFVIFHLAADDVKKHLPPGVEPQLNDQGLVNAFFEIYETERIAGLPAYKMAFIAVDIANHPSRTGVAGHFAIWGKVDSEASVAFFQRTFGFPYQYVREFNIEANQGKVLGSIGNSLRIQIEPLDENVSTSEGVVNMLSIHRDRNKGLINTEVLYLTKGRSGKIQLLDINAEKEPVLALLKYAQAQYTWIAEDQIFTYSSFTPQKINENQWGRNH